MTANSPPQDAPTRRSPVSRIPNAAPLRSQRLMTALKTELDELGRADSPVATGLRSLRTHH